MNSKKRSPAAFLGALMALSLMAALVVTGPARAASVLRVPQDFTTIQEAINSASPGDTVLVSPGTYAENINFNGKDITVASEAGPATTTLDASGDTGVQMGPDGSLRGLTIKNAAAYFGAGIAVSGSGSLISGNVFQDNVAFGGGFGAGIGGNSSSPTIERNVFRDNACDSQYIAGVVVFVNVSSPVIKNNVFVDNPCRAINMTLPAWTSPIVINNTIVGNAAGVRVDGRVPSLDQVYRNNIIVGNDIGLVVDFGSPPTWDRNLVYGNGTNYSGVADQTGLNGNISADPMFLNSGAGDFHLQPGSQAIDAGSDALAPPVDFDGVTRPQDGNGDGVAIVDIGAYELATIPVGIDIKPGSSTNPIKLSSGALIPVAIRTTDTFDATTVDARTVCFGDDDSPGQRDCTEAHGTGHVDDVNGDGRPDLLLHYEVGQTGVDPGDTTACLSGKTFAGTSVQGCDVITTL